MYECDVACTANLLELGGAFLLAVMATATLIITVILRSMDDDE